MPHDPCPPADALVAAASPTADRAARDQVADHLIGCARCAEEYRVALELGPWASRHAHLVGSPDAAPRVGSPESLSWWGPAQKLRDLRVWPAYAAAAALAVIAVSLSLEVRSLKRETRELSARVNTVPPAPPPGADTAQRSQPGQATAPQARPEQQAADQQQRLADLERRLADAERPDLNAPIIDLEPDDASRSAGRSTAPPSIPAGARQVVFVLNTPRSAAGASYEVDLVDGGGRAVWQGVGLKQSADGTLTLMLPRSLLESGTRIRLYSRAGNRRDLVEQYVVPSLQR